MNVRIKIKLHNKTLNKIDIAEGSGNLINNELVLKNKKNVFKINIESNIIFKKETDEYNLSYKFVEGLYTYNKLKFLKLNYNIMTDIITKRIINDKNKIIVDFDKYIDNEKEECQLIIEYKE